MFRSVVEISEETKGHDRLDCWSESWRHWLGNTNNNWMKVVPGQMLKLFNIHAKVFLRLGYRLIADLLAWNAQCARFEHSFPLLVLKQCVNVVHQWGIRFESFGDGVKCCCYCRFTCAHEALHYNIRLLLCFCCFAKSNFRLCHVSYECDTGKKTGFSPQFRQVHLTEVWIEPKSSACISWSTWCEILDVF